MLLGGLEFIGLGCGCQHPGLTHVHIHENTYAPEHAPRGQPSAVPQQELAESPKLRPTTLKEREIGSRNHFRTKLDTFFSTFKSCRFFFFNLNSPRLIKWLILAVQVDKGIRTVERFKVSLGFPCMICR